MNKFGIVLGVAAAVTIVGCKDPDYHRSTGGQEEVRNIDTTVTPSVTPVAQPSTPAPIAIEPIEAKCTCAPGTKHSSPCLCGASDCRCIVETKPVLTADLTRPAEPETTVYVVQSGDYLAKISKKFNVTINSIKRVNNMKGDTIRVGQKLKLPGKVDVGVQAPAPRAPARAAAKKAAQPAAYKGATKEYVVKGGDTLGSIAYGNGINIRQLKALNGLTSDSLKVGQKLKIPAEKVVAAPAKTSATPAAGVKKEVEKKPAEAVKPVEAAPVTAPEEVKPQPEVAAPPAAEPEPAKVEKEAAAPATMTYVVQEGDDMTGVSIRWGVPSSVIRQLNHLGENDQLTTGQILKLPADAQQ